MKWDNLVPRAISAFKMAGGKCRHFESGAGPGNEVGNDTQTKLRRNDHHHPYYFLGGGGGVQNAAKSDYKPCDYICSEDWAGVITLGNTVFKKCLKLWKKVCVYKNTPCENISTLLKIRNKTRNTVIE